MPTIFRDRHRDVSGGWLRASVFGAMDGLVSNGALISGMVGGGASASAVMLAGMAGLVAGASSMATGEYTSVATQSEATEAEIAAERRELERHSVEEQDELVRLYVSRGVDEELAREVVRQIHRNDEAALRVHVHEELGVDVDTLPSPWTAAGSSFAAFAVGAFVPVAALLLGASGVLPVMAVTLMALFVVGAIATRLTSRSAWFGGSRQLVLGVIAGATTFGVGSLFGGFVG